MPGLSTRRRRGPPAPIQTELKVAKDTLERRQGVLVTPLSPVLKQASPTTPSPRLVVPTTIPSRATSSAATLSTATSVPVATTKPTPAEVTRTIVQTLPPPPPSPTVFVTVVAPLVPPTNTFSSSTAQISAINPLPIAAPGQEQQNKGLESDRLGILPAKGVLFISVTGAMAGLSLAALALLVLTGRRRQQVNGSLEKP